VNSGRAEQGTWMLCHIYLESNFNSDTSESYNTRVIRLTKIIKNLIISYNKNPATKDINKIDIINKNKEIFEDILQKIF
jgi:hypothetical protein